MSRQIFINLPVRDVEAATAFFTGLGFQFNSQFASPDNACMVINDSTYAMLLSHKRFADFTPKPIADPTAATAALYALSADSREAVDALADAAVAAGGTDFREPQDHGFMYGRAFTDLDGHVWEVVWMDPQADMSATE
jgi:predicted lactoylglutathione lyase